MPFECCDKCGTKIAQLYAKVFGMRTYTLCGDCLDTFLNIKGDRMERLNWLKGGKDADQTLPEVSD